MNIIKAVDYLIVGSGSGGSVLANRLSLNRATSCLVLEAGGSDLYLLLRCLLAIRTP